MLINPELHSRTFDYQYSLSRERSMYGKYQTDNVSGLKFEFRIKIDFVHPVLCARWSLTIIPWTLREIQIAKEPIGTRYVLLPYNECTNLALVGLWQ